MLVCAEGVAFFGEKDDVLLNVVDCFVDGFVVFDLLRSCWVCIKVADFESDDDLHDVLCVCCERTVVRD